MVWDVHVAEVLGKDLSYMLKHEKGRENLFPSMRTMVQEELSSDKLALDGEQREYLADRLQLDVPISFDPYAKGLTSDIRSAQKIEVNKKNTGFQANPTVKDTLYDPKFMKTDCGDLYEDIEDLGLQKSLLNAMGVFRKAHKRDRGILQSYFADPVSIVYAMILKEETPAKKYRDTVTEISDPTQLPISRTLKKELNTDKENKKPGTNEHYRL